MFVLIGNEKKVKISSSFLTNKLNVKKSWSFGNISSSRKLIKYYLLLLYKTGLLVVVVFLV
jgi:hypothetical protein